MPLFESPQQLGDDEIKELQKVKTDNKLDDDMKDRLQDQQKRDLFVSEYKNYLERSVNEASKDMVTKLFGNVFDLAQAEGILVKMPDTNADGSQINQANTNPTAADLDADAQKNFNTYAGLDPNQETKNTNPSSVVDLDAQAKAGFQSEMGLPTEQKIESKELTLDGPLDLKAAFLSGLMDMKKQMELATKSDIPQEIKDWMPALSIICDGCIEAASKLNLPIITNENINDPAIQKQVEDAFHNMITDIESNLPGKLESFYKEQIELNKLDKTKKGEREKKLNELKDTKNTPFPLDGSFKAIVGEAKNFNDKIGDIKNQAKDAINMKNYPSITYNASTDIMINEKNEKELKPHRELVTNIVEGLQIDKDTGEKHMRFTDDEGKTINIYYQPDAGPLQGLTITKDINGHPENPTAYDGESESVTIACTFDKEGKLQPPKSLTYSRTTGDKSISDKQAWSGGPATYPKVEALLKSVGPSIVDREMGQDIAKS